MVKIADSSIKMEPTFITVARSPRGKSTDRGQSFEEVTEELKLLLATDSPDFFRLIDIADHLGIVASVLKKQKLLLQSLSSYESSFTAYRTALKMAQLSDHSNGPKERDVLQLQQKMSITVNCIGGLQFEKEDLGTAMVHFQRSLTYARQAEGMLRSSLCHTSDSAVDMSRNDLASLREIRLHTADVLSNIASVHTESENWTQAIKCYNEALDIQIKHLGEDSPSVSITISNIGTMNFRSGNYDSALKSYVQYLMMRQRLFGKYDVSICDALINIALTHERLNEWEQSERALVQALRVALKALGSKHAKVAYIKNIIGTVCVQHGKGEMAVKYFNSALSDYKATSKVDDDVVCGGFSFKDVAHVENSEIVSPSLTAQLKKLLCVSKFSSSIASGPNLLKLTRKGYFQL